MESQDKARGKLADMRWKILQDVVLKRVSNVADTSCSAASVRRFSGFGIFDIEEVSPDLIPPNFSGTIGKCEWKAYSFSANANVIVASEKASQIEQNSMLVRHLIDLPNAADLIGFDNTGNICVWPTEEVLAAHCISNARLMFNNQSVVLELGGGMTCLAGLSVARYVDCAAVFLTDGNERSIENLNEMIRVNRSQAPLRAGSVVASVLRWDDIDESLCATFDVIICADCLFYDKFRESLAICIGRLLKVGGVAHVMAPKRGRTLNKFLELFENGIVQHALERITKDGSSTDGHSADIIFEVSVKECYLDYVWNRNLQLTENRDVQYDVDIHYPYLIIISKQMRPTLM